MSDQGDQQAAGQGDPAHDPSAYYRVLEDERLGADEGFGSDAVGGPTGDDTDDLDDARTAPDQMFGTIGGGDRGGDQ